MKSFNSSLLREKFVIHDAKGGGTGNDGMVALSNRLIVHLAKGADDAHPEEFIVRGHNMHTVIRMAARIIQEYNISGRISTRQIPFDWERIWDSIVNDYEYAFNPQRWIAIYHGGKCIYESGEHHPFLDMIEKCDITNEDEYDYAIPLAKALFKQAGKDVEIHHDANVALTIDFSNNVGRLGIILRGSDRTTTFSFSVQPKEKRNAVNIPQSMNVAAAFLEGIQLSFLVGMNTEKIRIGKIERHSKDEKQTKDGRQRLIRLASEIANLENTFEVRYRPEKPVFDELLTEAEELAQRMFAPD